MKNNKKLKIALSILFIIILIFNIILPSTVLAQNIKENITQEYLPEKEETNKIENDKGVEIPENTDEELNNEEDKNVSDNEENNTEEQENDSINTKLDNNNNLEAQNQKEKTELVEENLRNKDC